MLACHVVLSRRPPCWRPVNGPVAAGHRLLQMGAQNAVTCGARGVQLVAADLGSWIRAVPAASVVDQTGAGDAYVGTLTARLL